MTTIAVDETTTGYFLHVDMYVSAKPEKYRAFEAAMRRFLKRTKKDPPFTFYRENFDSELALALKSDGTVRLPVDKPARNGMATRLTPVRRQQFLSVQNIGGDPRVGRSEEMYHYIHLWTIPHLEDLDLSRRMMFCSEDPEYMKIDEQVSLEDQNIVRHVDWEDDLHSPDLRMHFVRTVRQLKYENLGEYLLNVQGLLPSLNDRRWFGLGQYQNVTGRLNSVVEFWQTDGSKPTRTNSFGLKPPVDKAMAKFEATVAALPFAQSREKFIWAPYYKNPGKLFRL